MVRSFKLNSSCLPSFGESHPEDDCWYRWYHYRQRKCLRVARNHALVVSEGSRRQLINSATNNHRIFTYQRSF
jgi:hypothetical protein